MANGVNVDNSTDYNPQKIKDFVFEAFNRDIPLEHINKFLGENPDFSHGVTVNFNEEALSRLEGYNIDGDSKKKHFKENLQDFIDFDGLQQEVQEVQEPITTDISSDVDTGSDTSPDISTDIGSDVDISTDIKTVKDAKTKLSLEDLIESAQNEGIPREHIERFARENNLTANVDFDEAYENVSETTNIKDTRTAKAIESLIVDGRYEGEPEAFLDELYRIRKENPDLEFPELDKIKHFFEHKESNGIFYDLRNLFNLLASGGVSAGTFSGRTIMEALGVMVNPEQFIYDSIIKKLYKQSSGKTIDEFTQKDKYEKAQELVASHHAKNERWYKFFQLDDVAAHVGDWFNRGEEGEVSEFQKLRQDKQETKLELLEVLNDHGILADFDRDGNLVMTVNAGTSKEFKQIIDYSLPEDFNANAFEIILGTIPTVIAGVKSKNPKIAMTVGSAGAGVGSVIDHIRAHYKLYGDLKDLETKALVNEFTDSATFDLVLAKATGMSIKGIQRLKEMPVPKSILKKLERKIVHFFIDDNIDNALSITRHDFPETLEKLDLAEFSRDMDFIVKNPVSSSKEAQDYIRKHGIDHPVTHDGLWGRTRVLTTIDDPEALKAPGDPLASTKQKFGLLAGLFNAGFFDEQAHKIFANSSRYLELGVYARAKNFSEFTQKMSSQLDNTPLSKELFDKLGDYEAAVRTQFKKLDVDIIEQMTESGAINQIPRRPINVNQYIAKHFSAKIKSGGTSSIGIDAATKIRDEMDSIFSFTKKSRKTQLEYLMDLQYAISQVRKNNEFAPLGDAFDSMKTQVSNDIETFIKDKKLINYRNKVRADYEAFKKRLSGNNLYRLIKRNGGTLTDDKMRALIRASVEKDLFDLNDFLDAVSTRGSQFNKRLEFVTANELLNKYSINEGVHEGIDVKAINFPLYYEALTKVNFREKELKTFREVIRRTSRVFKGDVTHAHVLGNVEIPDNKTYLALSLKTRAQFAFMNIVMQNIKAVMPTKLGDRAILFNLLNQVLETPMQAKPIEELMKLVPKADKQAVGEAVNVIKSVYLDSIDERVADAANKGLKDVINNLGDVILPKDIKPTLTKVGDKVKAIRISQLGNKTNTGKVLDPREIADAKDLTRIFGDGFKFSDLKNIHVKRMLYKAGFIAAKDDDALFIFDQIYNEVENF